MRRSLEGFSTSIEMLLAHLSYERESQVFFKDGLSKYSGDSEFEIEFRDFVGNVVGESSVRTRIYSYQNSIISLYGYLERFIEDVIVEYLKGISAACPEYDQLPASIRKNHLGLSMDLITKIQKIKGWSATDRKARLSDAVSNMNHFLSEQGEPKINYDAFISHTANFRYDTVHEIFSKIGIDSISRQCLADEKLVLEICERNGLDAETSHKTLLSSMTAELDDLAQRRNEIAHGVRLDEIESPELTRSRIMLISSYVCAIAGVIERHANQYIYEVSPRVPLGVPDCIFPKIQVIGFKGLSLPDGYDGKRTISVGDKLVCVNENSSQKFISGHMVSLQHNNTDQSSVDLPCDGDISMKVDFEFSDNFGKRSIFVIATP